MQLSDHIFLATKNSRVIPAVFCTFFELLFYDFQNFHGANLDTDAAGDARGRRIFGLENHNLHGANFYALTTGNTLLLVDHVNAGLGVLGNCLMLTGLHALSALNAGHGLGAGALTYYLNAGIILMEFLVKCLRASPNALKTCHTFNILLNRESLHIQDFSFYVF